VKISATVPHEIQIKDELCLYKKDLTPSILILTPSILIPLNLGERVRVSMSVKGARAQSRE